MKHFRIQCIVRVLALAATMLAGIFMTFMTTAYVAAGLLGVAVVYQVAALIHYVERTSRDLARFLHSIRFSDFSQAFTSGGRGSSFKELSLAIGKVMDEFRAERAEKEENYRYLQTVMQHVGIALLSFKQDGTIGLINNAAKRLLRVTYLHNIAGLERFSPALVQALMDLKAGEKTLVQVVDGDELLQLSIYTTEFKLRGDLYKLVSIQNIQSELEEKEIEAWQKLTRVLTHEIMNSITPIASLASTINEMLADSDVLADHDGAVTAETIGDVRSAVNTIERRSQSLLTFVNAYRSLTRIPKPDLKIFPIANLFDEVKQLFRSGLEEKGIRFVCEITPPGLDLTADPELIGQVLINLLKNASEAVQNRTGAEIQLLARLDERGRTLIQVVDNGPGIVEEAVEKIFIPFFTTKKEGSGIGLSLSRQIMRQHGGTLSVTSDPDIRTVFTLRF